MPESALASGTSLFARAIQAVGDCDGDGLREFATSAPFAARGDGVVQILSARTHSVLFELRPAQAGRASGFGQRLAALPDLDGDGIEELAADGFHADGSGAVFSLGRRRVLFAVEGRPEQLLVCRDLDGDGGRDLLVCDRTTTALSGRDGTPIEVPELADAAGPMVPLRARTDAGTRRTLGLQCAAGGECLLYDGLASVQEPLQRAHFGFSEFEFAALAKSRFPPGYCAGDFDHDGLLDLVECRFREQGSKLGTDRLVVRALGSRSGAALFERAWAADSDPPERLADLLGLPGDLDADGTPDLIVGAPFAWAIPGDVHALSGADGSEIWRVEPLKPVGGGRLETGVSIAILDDVDRDGIDDVAAGCGDYHRGAGTEKAGIVLILSGRTGREIRRLVELR